MTKYVLMKLNCKEGNREQLRMVFNDVDEGLNEDLKKPRQSKKKKNLG